jgi:type I restriction enzyme S subunit
MAQAIFKSWFVDFEPFGGVMPDDWREGTLGEICRFQAGFAFPKDEQGAIETDIPFIKVSDMNLPQNNFFIVASNNWISRSTSKRLKLKLIPVDAVVFAKIGEALKVERLRVITQPTAIDNNMMAAIPLSNDFTEFLLYILDSIHLASWAEGSALPFLRQSDLMEIPIVIPSESALKEFSAVVAPIAKEKLAKSEESAKLAEIRDTLLPRLMSGELSVADVSDAK